MEASPLAGPGTGAQVKREPMASSCDPLNGLASGPALAAALAALPALQGAELTRLISAALHEARAAAAASAAASPAVGPAGRPAAGPATPPEPPAEVVDLSLARSVVLDVSLLAPRGRWDVGFFADELVFVPAAKKAAAGATGAAAACAAGPAAGTSKSAGPVLRVKYVDVVGLAVFQRTTEPRKVYFMVHLLSDRPLCHGRQRLLNLLISSPEAATLDVADPRGAPAASAPTPIPGPRFKGQAAVVWCQVFSATCRKAPVSSKPSLFTGARTPACCRATVRVSVGLLFPLPSGLVFVETPALFIPLTTIRAAELSRTGGPSATFDLLLHLADESVQEFNMIDREELPRLQEYLTSSKVPMGASADDWRPAGAAGAGAAAGADAASEPAPGAGPLDGDASDDSSDEDDDDFDPGASSGDDSEDGEAASGGSGSESGDSSGDDSEGEGAAPKQANAGPPRKKKART